MRRFLFVFGALVCAFPLWFVFKSYTWPIWTESGIAALEAISVNGDRLYVLIRGEDRNAPVLFFLHGGPGMAAMYLGVILAARRPDLVEAYVGIGQIADRAESVQGKYLKGKLRELGLPEDTKIDGRNPEALLFKSGSELRDATSPHPLIMTGFSSTEYSLFDGLNVPKGPMANT